MLELDVTICKVEARRKAMKNICATQDMSRYLRNLYKRMIEEDGKVLEYLNELTEFREAAVQEVE